MLWLTSDRPGSEAIPNLSHPVEVRCEREPSAGVAGVVFVKGMHQAFVGVLAVAVGSGAASFIVLGRKSGMDAIDG